MYSSRICGSDLHMEMRILSCTEISKRATKVNFFTPCYLPPANKVCEGYVFTGVCLSSGGGGSRSLSRGSPSRGSPSGGSLSGVSVQGGLCQGVSVQGGLCSGVSLSRETPRTVTGGRYASYWNAFLFTLFCCSICPGCITIWSWISARPETKQKSIRTECLKTRNGKWWRLRSGSNTCKGSFTLNDCVCESELDIISCSSFK